MDLQDCRMIPLLLVEDEVDTRNILGSIVLKKYPGIDLQMARNGEEGLSLFMAHRPPIVVTDISMALMNGIDMASEIKAVCPETVIIAVTAFSDTKYLLDAIEIGINHYVLKPLDYKKFFTILDKHIATIQLERQVRTQSAFIRKLSRAVEQSPSMVVITDADGTIEYVNPKYTEVTGFTLTEVVEKKARLLESAQIQTRQYAELWQTIKSGSEWRGQFRNYKKSGEEYWESATISPLVSEDGTISNFVAVNEDITARKESEREIEILNEKLASRAKELEAANRELEAFNYTVSHDLRSPITAIHGFSQVLLEKCCGPFDEQAKDCAEVIHQEIRRMEEMLKSLLKFSRLGNQPLEQTEVNLSDIVSTILMELKLRNPQRRISTRVAQSVHGYGDPILLRVVLENLLGNAWKYTSGKENPMIEFGLTQRGGQECYYVCDNGVGFDNSQCSRLFGAFQRLHDDKEFEGYGIGLATVQRIIQRHGGTIEAEGEIGKGATFYFTLGRPSVTQ